MTKTSKKGLIPFLIFLILLISTIVSVNPVTGITAEITLENWESYNIGSSFGVGNYFTWERISGDDGVIANRDSFGDGSKSLYFDTSDENGDEKVYLNSTENIGYCNRVCLYIDYVNIELTTSAENHYIYFYNNNSVVLSFNIETTYSSYLLHTNFKYKDSSGTWHSLFHTTGSDVEDIYYLEINHISGNTMNYSLSNSTSNLGYSEDSSGSILDWNTFDQIYFDFIDAGDSGSKIYFDDIEITSGTSINPIPDYSDKWKYFGNVDTYLYSNRNGYKYLEFYRQVPFTGIIKQLDIAFSSDYFDYRDSSDLHAYICGINLGSPTVSICKSTTGTVALAQWKNLELTITSSYPVVELKSDKQVYDKYWNSIGVWNEDKDNDGRKNFMQHNIDSAYGDGVAGGTYNYLQDIAYRIWYVREGTALEDNLKVQKSELDMYDTNEILYKANLDETKYLIIKNFSSIEVYNETLTDVDGSVYYTPILSYGIGLHTVIISNKTGVSFANNTFNVTSPAYINWGVWVNKNTLLVNEQFTTFFVLPSNETGEIIIKKDSIRVTSLSVDGNDNIQSFKYSLPTDGTYNLVLYRNVLGTFYYRDDETVVVGALSYLNYVTVDKQTIKLGDTIEISGKHSYYGHNIYIEIFPSTKTFDISNNIVYSLNYQPSELGDYTVYLKLENDTIDSINFVVTTIQPEDEGNPLLVYIKNLDSFVKLSIGVGVCIIMILLPLIVMAKLEIEIEIPSFVYLILGCIGVIIAMFIGCWGWEIPFFICFISVMIGLLSWLHGRE